MQEHSHAVDVRIGIEMINSRSVERTGAANDAVDFIALFQQKIGEITSVLTSDPGNERLFHSVPLR